MNTELAIPKYDHDCSGVVQGVLAEGVEGIVIGDIEKVEKAEKKEKKPRGHGKWQRARKMRANGWSWMMIAKEIGVRSDTVRKKFKEEAWELIRELNDRSEQTRAGQVRRAMAVMVEKEPKLAEKLKAELLAGKTLTEVARNQNIARRLVADFATREMGAEHFGKSVRRDLKSFIQLGINRMLDEIELVPLEKLPFVVSVAMDKLVQLEMPSFGQPLQAPVTLKVTFPQFMTKLKMAMDKEREVQGTTLENESVDQVSLPSAGTNVSRPDGLTET